MFKKKSLTPTSLGIRIFIGGYLLYLAYSLIPAIQNAPNTKELIFWIFIVAVFSMVGVLAIILSAKSLLKGEYDKGAANDKTSGDLLVDDTKKEEEIEGQK